MAETVIASVEAAQAALAEGEDEAREIVADDTAGPKPERMAEALLEAGDELVVAMSLLCTGGDSVGTVVEHLDAAMDALTDAHDAAEEHLASGGGERGAAVARALLEAEPLVDEAVDLVGAPGGDVPDEGGDGEELPPVEPDPDLSGMNPYQPEPGTPQELTAALDALDGKPACRDTFVRCKASLALTGTYLVKQSGFEGSPLVITAPEASIGQRDPGPKPSFKHLKVTGKDVWVHGLACELPASDQGAAVLLEDGCDGATITRCWLDAPAGVLVKAAKNFKVFANDYYGEQQEWCGGQFGMVITKSGPLPEDGRVGRNYFSQLKDIGAGSTGAACYTGDGVQNPSGDKSEPYDRNVRSTVFFDNFIRSQKSYLVYNKHALTVLRNRLISVKKHGDKTGTGKAYHMLASRGGNWCQGRFAYNALECAEGAHCDFQGWNGLAEFNDFGGCVVNVWCGMDQQDGKALLGANGWVFRGNEGGKYQVGTTRNGAYHLQWPLLDVTWIGEQGAAWRWEASAPEGSSYQPSGGPEVTWGGDGRNSQALTLREGGKDKVAVAVGQLTRDLDGDAGGPGMDLAYDLDETNTGLAYRAASR